MLVLKLLKFLTEQGKPLSQVVAPYKKYANSGEINLKLPSREVGLQKIAEVKEKFADGTQSCLDGISVEYPTWWFNVRLSNTEPLIRFIVEAVDEATMRQKKEQLRELLAAA